MDARRKLHGSRIRLVAIERHHLKKRVEFINDPAVQATLNFDYPTSLSKTEAWLNKNILSSTRVDFAIETLDGDKTIGFGGLIGIDKTVRKAELYIFIGDKSYWGGGYGSEGYKLITNFGFSELGLNRIYGYQLEENEKALSAVEKIGWTNEGLLRRDVMSHGLLKNRWAVSILRDEWESNSVYDDL